ncbi:hypothetical protein EJ03DRAFT_384316 [Teratosphaeria nubilosa]|uniref:Uncharacterized protein n=1 Tax=Teratosphaeria nubilosa TaxID=161662 RepID=A0A6G1L2X4_9PEZI|nr:hypothetical protein EJ03DRAFT_384316 [Teratosphaeria nubilosa]
MATCKYSICHSPRSPIPKRIFSIHQQTYPQHSTAHPKQQHHSSIPPLHRTANNHESLHHFPQHLRLQPSHGVDRASPPHMRLPASPQPSKHALRRQRRRQRPLRLRRQLARRARRKDSIFPLQTRHLPPKERLLRLLPAQGPRQAGIHRRPFALCEGSRPEDAG